MIFVNILMVRQIRRNKRHRAPECPICGSRDVSFGGEVSVGTFHKPRLATNIALLGSLGMIITVLKPNVFPQSWSLSPYIFAVPVLGLVIQFLSTGLNAKHVRRSRKLSNGRICWVCETCKNEWESLERPIENAPAAPAPLIR